MTGLIFTIAALLILVIVILVLRISQLTRVMKGEAAHHIGFSNKVNAILLPLVFFAGLVGIYFSFMASRPYYLPEASSIHGKETDFLFWGTMGLLMVAFVITNALLFVFPYLYQYKEGKKAYFYPDNHKLELIWTIIPAIVMATLVFFGWKVWAGIMDPAKEKGSEVIEVMGKQFAWQVRYPGADGKLGHHSVKFMDETNEFGIDLADSASYDDFTPRELHLPKGKTVTLHIRARDVLHSVFLPHFRVKMDAVPGMPTKFTFTPTKSTAEMRKETGNPKFNYELACTEVCGRGHYAMRYLVVVDEQADYDKWKKEQQTWVAVNADYVANHPRAKQNKLAPAPKVAEEHVPADTSAAMHDDSTGHDSSSH
jgi:cytochrome c oxidase subunit 2